MRTVENFKKMRFIAVLALVALLISCAKEDSASRSKLQRGQPGAADTQDDAATKAPDTETLTETPDSKSTTGTPPEIFTSGEKGFKLEPFRLPEIIIQRQIQRGEIPTLPSTAYQMHNADLVIDLEKSEMRLQVDIEAKGVREKLELKGSFNKHSQIWEGQLLASDPAILKQRRIQAVALCIKPYICDQVWMDLYYFVDGKPVRRQFVSGAEPAMVPISESLSVPLPEADANGMVTLPEAFVTGDTEEAEAEEPTAAVQTPQNYPLDPGLARAVEEQKKKEEASQIPLPRPRPNKPTATPAVTPAPKDTSSVPPEMFNHNYPQDAALKAKLEQYAALQAGAKTVDLNNQNYPQDEALKKKLEEYIAKQAAAPQTVAGAPATTNTQTPKVYPLDPGLQRAVEAYNKRRAELSVPYPRPLSERPPQKVAFVFPRPLSERPQAPKVETVVTPKPETRTVQVHQDDIPVEYTTEMQLSLPEQSEYSIQGSEDLKIDVGDDKRWGIQAKGSHTNGSLQNGMKLDANGCGFKRRNASGQIWGTGLLLEMITEAACIAETEIKRGFPLLIGGISLRYGGDGGDPRSFGHSSHRNGLDADLGLYHKNQDISQFWKPLSNNFSANFDYEKNWSFLKALHSTSEKRVMIVFLDNGIKSKMCDWVKRTEGLPTDPKSPEFKALRHLSHWAGHANHYHVRLYCPSTTGCVNKQADPRATGTGC